MGHGNYSAVSDAPALIMDDHKVIHSAIQKLIPLVRDSNLSLVHQVAVA